MDGEPNMSVQEKPGGRGLKIVRYRIVFTKRDYEATLKEGEEPLNHSIDAAAFAQLKVAQFAGDLQRAGEARPQVWRDKNYPQGVSGDLYHKIPDEDRKYVRVIFAVLYRSDGGANIGGGE